MNNDKQLRATDNGFAMAHPVVWGLWTQDYPDTIHIIEYWDKDINQPRTVMCGFFIEDEPYSMNNFVVGNEKICKDCLDEYVKNGGSQAINYDQ